MRAWSVFEILRWAGDDLALGLRRIWRGGGARGDVGVRNIVASRWGRCRRIAEPERVDFASAACERSICGAKRVELCAGGELDETSGLVASICRGVGQDHAP